jgi:hypothetical protein
MLYDPKYGRPNELTTLLAWLESKPSDGVYYYSNCRGCLLHKYYTEMGYADVRVGGHNFAHGDKEEMLPEFFNEVAVGRNRFGPHTFGAAAERARYRIMFGANDGFFRRLFAKFSLALDADYRLLVR